MDRTDRLVLLGMFRLLIRGIFILLKQFCHHNDGFVSKLQDDCLEYDLVLKKWVNEEV